MVVYRYFENIKYFDLLGSIFLLDKTKIKSNISSSINGKKRCELSSSARRNIERQNLKIFKKEINEAFKNIVVDNFGLREDSNKLEINDFNLY